MCLNEFEEKPNLTDSMSSNTSTMLPPKTPQCPHSNASLIHSTQYHPNNSDTSLAEEELSINLDGNGMNANLGEDSMMVLSQSIDSIHTIGTTNGGDGLEQQVRTLFVSGLPLDAKPRELYLLFRSFKGYLSSTLKPAGKNGKPTAPVGFVTFELREQAEKAMSKLQGVKFDPDGIQHMRLEFARSNTKVTKPKPTIPTGFGNMSGHMTNNHPNPVGINPHSPIVSLGAYPPNLIPAHSNLAGMVTGLQPSLFAQIAATSTANAFETQNGMFATSSDASTVAAAAAAAAAVAQWNPISGLPSLASAYDNAAYLTSAAGLIQTNNFRGLIPGNINSNAYGNGTSLPSLQMVQAAIAQANAAAALGSSNVPVTGSVCCPSSTITLSPQIHSSQTTSFCPTGGGTPTSCSSPSTTGTGSSPSTTTCSGFQITSPPLRPNNFITTHQLVQSQMNSFVAHLQHHHQHQTLAAVQLNQHANPNSATPSLGFTNIVSTPAEFPPQMAAAAIGLLGGYNSIMKELGGNEGHLQTGLPAYQANVNF